MLMSGARSFKISVLDQGQIPLDGDSSAAVNDTIFLAKLADKLGFERFWVTEHHSSEGYASSAPAVLIAAIASNTERIRVGSGAVLLPVHSSLVVAEQFGTLVAAFGHRIDLGIGRSTGADPHTSIMLRGTSDEIPEEEFIEKLDALDDLFAGSFSPDGHTIIALPGRGDAPQIWLLGSTEYSAKLAGQRGLPFAFAHHFSGEITREALATYQRSFRPSVSLQTPYCAISVGAISDDDPSIAESQWRPALINFARRREGKPFSPISVEEGKQYVFTDREMEFVTQRNRGQIIGNPADVARSLRALHTDLGVDEFIAVPMGAERENRARTLEILSGVH